jgi:hypothetical protein
MIETRTAAIILHDNEQSTFASPHFMSGSGDELSGPMDIIAVDMIL